MSDFASETKTKMEMEKLLNKRNVSILVILLILVAGGLFFWWQSNKEIKGSPDDYIIKETPQGIFVENKKAGLIVKAPEGWVVKMIEEEEGAIDFGSLDLETNKKEGKIVLPLEKGCKIQAAVEYGEFDITNIEIEIRYSLALMGMKSVYFEETAVNNSPALKSTFGLEEDSNLGISISIPSDNKVYGFSVMWGFEEKEKCIQEFNEFLETISIQ
jgi:hypothetical protein